MKFREIPRREYIPDPDVTDKGEKTHPMVDIDALDNELGELYEKIDTLPDPSVTISKIEGYLIDSKESLAGGEVKFFETLLTRIMDRIQKECPITKRKYIGFIQALKLLDKSGATEGDAAYYPESGQIVMGDILNLDPKVIIANIAKTGRDDTVEALHHEYLHSLQHDQPAKIKRREKLKRRIKGAATIAGFSAAALSSYEIYQGMTVVIVALLHFLESRHAKAQRSDEQMLREVHSYFGAAGVLGPEDIDLVLSEYKHIKVNPAKVAEADKLIKQLYALGFSDTEVSKLINISKWSSRSKTYGPLHEQVRTGQIQRGLNEDQMENLVAVQRVQESIDMQKSAIVANEELQFALSELKTKEVTM